MTQAGIELVRAERRRRWTRVEKERLVAASFEPGVSASDVARRAGLHVSQLFRWRKLLCERVGGPTPALVPVVITPTSAAMTVEPGRAHTRRRSRKRRSSATSALGSACRSHAVRLIDGGRHRVALVEPGVASTSVLARRRFIAQSRTTRGRMSAPARISPRASSVALRQPAFQRASR